MSKRAKLGYDTGRVCDSAALHGLVAEMVSAAWRSLRLMREMAKLDRLRQDFAAGESVAREADFPKTHAAALT